MAACSIGPLIVDAENILGPVSQGHTRGLLVASLCSDEVLESVYHVGLLHNFFKGLTIECGPVLKRVDTIAILIQGLEQEFVTIKLCLFAR